MTKIHATVVSIKDKGVLLRGPSGAGKSDFALRLIDQGATLVADDFCAPFVRQTDLWVQTPEAIQGLIEARGVGILKVPFIESSKIHLVCDLVSNDEVERFPDPPFHTEISGVTVPMIKICPFNASSVALVRMTLDQLPHLWPSKPS